MLSLLIVFTFVFLSSAESASNMTTIHYLTSDFKIIARTDPSKPENGSLAWAVFRDEINKTGWSFFEVHTNDSIADGLQAYSAGLIEGYLTHELMTAHFSNKLADYCNNKTFCDRHKKFVTENIKFAKQMIANNPNDSYWHHVSLVLKQVTGVQDGYDQATKKKPPSGERIEIDPLGVAFLLNLVPDLDGLEEALNRPDSGKAVGEGHCSAIVKPLQDGSDLLTAHNMWSSYSSMLRVIKLYDLRYRRSTIDKRLVPGSAIACSSYPGAVLSIDDFYVMSSKLVVQETTFEIIWNETLWDLVKPDCVLEFVRVMVANRLASDGREWTELFTKHNSGTYNSQFMIVDYNKFAKSKANGTSHLKDGLLWIAEQLPGMMKSKDVTSVLREKGYWSSYNIPYDKEVYNRAGYPNLVTQYGDYFSYESTARAKLFRRDQSSVKDLKSLFKLMRSNNFKTDPLSQYPNSSASGDLAISGRNDLNDPNGTFPVPSLAMKGRGAIDAKMVDSAMVDQMWMLAVGGPTDESLPAFQWSTAHPKVQAQKHQRQPDRWAFDAMLVKWWPEKPKQDGAYKK